MKPLYTFLLCITCFIGFSQDADSPYLLVATENANVTLQSSITEVNIDGTIAHFRVTLVYQKKGGEAIEPN